jgi:hypothetical protein
MSGAVSMKIGIEILDVQPLHAEPGEWAAGPE